jgi:hypothetical protein
MKKTANPCLHRESYPRNGWDNATRPHPPYRGGEVKIPYLFKKYSPEGQTSAMLWPSTTRFTEHYDFLKWTPCPFDFNL